MIEPTEQDIRTELIKLTIEHNQVQRNLRASDAKKNFAISRCFSFEDYMCKADDMLPCRLQCYDRNVNILNPKTIHEILAKKAKR